MTHTRSAFSVQSSALFLLVMVGIATRWVYRGRYLEGWDSVDFALALRDFDLAKQQPHLPGYPIYVALARGSQWAMGHDITPDTDALILPGIVFGSLAAIPIALLASQWTARYITLPPPSPVKGEGTRCHASPLTDKDNPPSPFVPRDGLGGASAWAGFIAASLYLLSPGLWLQAEKPLSDALGCALLPWVLLALVHALDSDAGLSSPPRWVGVAGVLMGLVLGIRLSYWPFVLGCALVLLLQRPTRFNDFARWGCGGLGIGTAVWLFPLMAHTGLTELAQESVRFGSGHFTRWGGTIFSDDAGMGRYLTWWWGIWAFSLGGYWPEAPQHIWRVMFSISVCFFLLWGLLHRPIRPSLLLVGAFIAPYLAWILIGQNPERPRHALPLILFLYPLAGITVGAWMLRWAKTKLIPVGPAVGVLAAICSGLIAFPLVKAYAETIPPQVAVVEHVETHFDPAATRVFTWETQRLFAYYAPEFNATRARGLPDVAGIVNGADLRGTVLFTSKLGQKRSKDFCFDYLTTFRRCRYVEPWFWTVSLFSYCGVRDRENSVRGFGITGQGSTGFQTSPRIPDPHHVNGGCCEVHE